MNYEIFGGNMKVREAIALKQRMQHQELDKIIDAVKSSRGTCAETEDATLEDWY